MRRKIKKIVQVSPQNRHPDLHARVEGLSGRGVPTRGMALEGLAIDVSGPCTLALRDRNPHIGR